MKVTGCLWNPCSPHVWRFHGSICTSWTWSRLIPTSFLRTNCHPVFLLVNPHYAPLIAQLFSACFAVKGHSCQHTKGRLSSNKREHDYKSYWVECKVEIKQEEVESLGRTIIFLLKGHGMFVFGFVCFFVQISAQGFCFVSRCWFLTEGKSPGSLCSPAF